MLSYINLSISDGIVWGVILVFLTTSIVTIILLSFDGFIWNLNEYRHSVKIIALVATVVSSIIVVAYSVGIVSLLILMNQVRQYLAAHPDAFRSGF